MQLRLGLKAHNYWSLARRNPWLLRCDEKVRNYLRYQLTPRRERIAPRSAGPIFLTLSITRRCNPSCRFCIVGDVINKSRLARDRGDGRRHDARHGPSGHAALSPTSC